MKRDSSTIGDLARTSLRMHGLLVAALSLTVILLVLCYWLIRGLVQQASDEAITHFQQLTYDLHVRESFLQRLVATDSSSLDRASLNVRPALYDMIASDSRGNVYEGQPSSMSMPFIIKVGKPASDSVSDHSRHLIPVATALSNLYGDYRYAWQNSGAQVFLLDRNGPASIAMPCSEGVMTDDQHRWWRCRMSADYIRSMISTHASDPGGTNVRWMRSDVPGVKSGRQGFLLYRSISLPDSLWLPHSARRDLVAAAFVELLDSPVLRNYDDRASFQGITHTSTRRASHAEQLASAGRADEIRASLRFALQGVEIETASDSGWLGSYRVSYHGFFRASVWRVLSFVAILFMCIFGGIWLYRRHLVHVVRPAQRSHQRIVDSESFSRAVIEAARVAVSAVRLSDGKIVAKNRLADEWLGEEEITARLAGKSMATGCHGGDGQNLIVNGRHLSMSCSSAMYREEAVMLVTFSDVTDHVRAREALAVAKQAADEANTGKTVFLATMSHEIRTPLYGMLGTIELLGLSPLTPQQKGYLDTIKTSSAELLDIISDVLDISKIESRQMTLKEAGFSPIQITEEALRVFAPAADSKGLQFYAMISTKVPATLRGDALRIKQILNNLLSNAVKFTEAGWIRLTLDAVPGDDGRTLMTWCISDTGIGISDEQKQRLFQPFYQVQDSQSSIAGAGLGLYICSSLCEMMGGSISLESSPGRGATFTVAIPLEGEPDAVVCKHEFFKRDQVVFVRSPIQDFAQSICAWLELGGARALPVSSNLAPGDGTPGVLVDLFPERMPPMEWDSPRVAVSLDGPDPPERGVSSINVTSLSLLAIGRATCIAQQGDEVAARLFAAHADSVEKPFRPAMELRRLGLRVLVAEDNPVNRTLLMHQLEELGCSVSICANGDETLKRWNNADFDVLLTDMNLPGMSGYDLTGTLRARGVNAPIIGVTASAQPDQRELGESVGLTAWVIKPIDLRTLYDILRRACADGGPAGKAGYRAPPPSDHQRGLQDTLHAVFRETMSKDLPTAWQALADRDGQEVAFTLHRMRGALAVVRATELASFCEVLEERISADGLTPVLINAMRSMLEELDRFIKDF